MELSLVADRLPRVFLGDLSASLLQELAIEPAHSFLEAAHLCLTPRLDDLAHPPTSERLDRDDCLCVEADPLTLRPLVLDLTKLPLLTLTLVLRTPHFELAVVEDCQVRVAFLVEQP